MRQPETWNLQEMKEWSGMIENELVLRAIVDRVLQGMSFDVVEGANCPRLYGIMILFDSPALQKFDTKPFENQSSNDHHYNSSSKK